MLKLNQLIALITIIVLITGCNSSNNKPITLPKGKLIAQCNFEGPYVKGNGKDLLQKGCLNNYSWGKKIIHIYPDSKGINGSKCQCIDIKGISSGQLQFWFTNLQLWRGRYYKFSFWAKGQGFQGSEISAFVRKIPKPWTTYMKGIKFQPTQEWKQYSFIDQAPTDVDRDFGLMFATGGMGKLWIDNIRVEVFDDNPMAKIETALPLIKGNLLSRSSFEGKVDNYWTSGVYGDPDAEWEDPQIRRAPNGRFGKYCQVIPSSKHNGSVFSRSFWLDVVPGKTYQFSVFLKADKPCSKFSIQVFNLKQKIIFGKNLKLTDKWQRYTTSGKVPIGVNKVFISMTNRKNNESTVYADGAEFKLVEKQSPKPLYTPKYPIELYANIGQKAGNIIHWNENIPLKLLAASALKDCAIKTLNATVKITAYPDIKISKRDISLTVNSEMKLPLSTKQNGLIRITISPKDKKLAAPQEILVAKLPKPRDVGKESAFGTHITVRPFFVDYAKKIGMKWVRFHDGSKITKWDCAEPKPGQYRWFDTQVNAILKEGLFILGLPDCTPDWARIKPGKGENVINLDAYKKFIRKISAHYKGRIDYWEIWNEPYMKYFFKGTPKQYGQILNIGSQIIKEENPNAKILGFCTEINDIAWAEKIPKPDRKYIDILSFHCYLSNLTGGGSTNLKQEIDDYKHFLGKNAPKECWNSEGNNEALGKNSFYSFLPVNKQQNERAVAFGSRVWMEHLKAGINKFFLYTTHQSDTIMYYGGYKLLIGYDRSVTPAAVATAVTAWCIDGLQCFPCQQQPDVIQSLFQGDKRAVWSVYSDPASGQTKYLDITKLPSTFQLIDTMGNNLRLTKNRRIPIGIKPIFVLTNNLPASELRTACLNSLLE